jgi:hypothetical protein
MENNLQISTQNITKQMVGSNYTKILLIRKEKNNLQKIMLLFTRNFLP